MAAQLTTKFHRNFQITTSADPKVKPHIQGLPQVHLPRIKHINTFKPCTSKRTATKMQAQRQQFKSFDDVVKAAPVVLVDFYATWCGPCVMQSNILQEASQQMKDTPIKFIKIDTEKYPQLASRFQVSALPTLVLFKNGRPVARSEGVMSAPDLQRWINAYLLSSD